MSKPKFQVGDLVKVKPPPWRSRGPWYKRHTYDLVGLVVRVIRPVNNNSRYAKKYHLPTYEIGWSKCWKANNFHSVTLMTRTGFNKGYYRYTTADLQLVSRFDKETGFADKVELNTKIKELEARFAQAVAVL